MNKEQTEIAEVMLQGGRDDAEVEQETGATLLEIIVLRATAASAPAADAQAKPMRQRSNATED